MRPQRLVVGEVRQQEWLDLLIALNSSSPGCAPSTPTRLAPSITELTPSRLAATSSREHGHIGSGRLAHIFGITNS
jgi:pilus assembly protein CpaF